METSYDLIMLMLNLSRLDDKGEVKELFTGGMSEIFKPVGFDYSDKAGSEVKDFFEVRTLLSQYGYVRIDNPESLSGERRQMIDNAVQMLAVILERLDFEKRLKEERDSLEKIAEERLLELKKNIKDLHRSRNASLNLIEDMEEEIAKRISYEKDLAESEEKYRLILDNSFDAILLTVPDGTILSVNKAACKMFGMTEEELIKGGKDAILDPDNPGLTDMLSERSKKGKIKGELIFRRSDGTRFPAEVSTSLYSDSKGEIRSSMIISDITERRETENKVSKLREQLRQELDQKTLELRERITELERFQKATIEREFRIKELRDEVAKLKAEQGV
ncbi:MAG: PAS domain S-box protein [Bacteroidales bacterium]|nr:PAS domain S-box protein [Bacteroidales bacterium]